VLVQDGRAVALERHLTRLGASLRKLYGMDLPPGLPARVHAVAAEQPAGRVRLRILADPEGPISVEVSTAGAGPVEIRLLAPFALPGGLGEHKWRDRRLLDALAVQSDGMVPLLVDTDGAVLEAAYANVWIVEGGELITPPADGRILPGTARAELLESEPRLAREEAIDLARLARADSVFLTSSISGRHPATLATVWIMSPRRQQVAQTVAL
jgi:para-aminobenzoate synthetase/4-amino-4-deoxychorismate lyase